MRFANHQNAGGELGCDPYGGKKVIQQNDVGVHKTPNSVPGDGIDLRERVVKTQGALIALENSRQMLDAELVCRSRDSNLGADKHHLRVAPECQPTAHRVPLNLIDLPGERLRNRKDRDHDFSSTNERTSRHIDVVNDSLP